MNIVKIYEATTRISEYSLYKSHYQHFYFSSHRYYYFILLLYNITNNLIVVFVFFSLKLVAQACLATCSTIPRFNESVCIQNIVSMCYRAYETVITASLTPKRKELVCGYKKAIINKMAVIESLFSLLPLPHKIEILQYIFKTIRSKKIKKKRITSPLE